MRELVIGKSNTWQVEYLHPAAVSRFVSEQSDGSQVVIVQHEKFTTSSIGCVQSTTSAMETHAYD